MSKSYDFYKFYAPEILEKNEISLKGDVFNLGVMFYKIITGNYPFKE